MYLTETFVIGTDAGQYPGGCHIQDSIFRDSRIAYILRNDTPQHTGYSVHNSRMYFEQCLQDGDVITVNFYKY